MLNQLTMLQAETEFYKRRQSSICNRISGSIYSHRDLQIKEIYSASKCETSDVISDIIYVWWCYVTYVACITSLTAAWGAENAKSNNFSKSELFLYQNVPHVLTKKMPAHT